MAQQIIDTTTPQPNGKIGDTAKVAFGKVNDNFAELYDAVANIPEDISGDIEALDVRVTANEGAISALQGDVANLEPFVGSVEAMTGYIDGLRMEWVSGTSLRVTGGAAYVPGLQGILGVESPITKSGLSLSANTWYHLYLYRNGGSADIEISTTEPAEPYSGAARTKSGDNTRRYIGSIRTRDSGEVAWFRHELPGRILTSNSGSRVLTDGTQVSPPANISLTGAIPVTSRVVRVLVENTSASTVAFSNPDLTTTSPGSAALFLLRSTGVGEVEMPTSEGRQINYAYFATPAAGTGATVWVVGYSFER